jgi:hypothetical protein
MHGDFPVAFVYTFDSQAAEFWQPKLTVAGYDSLFVPRTSFLRPRAGPSAEGVLLCWDRDQFSLARSEEVHLNDQFQEVRVDSPIPREKKKARAKGWGPILRHFSRKLIISKCVFFACSSVRQPLCLLLSSPVSALVSLARWLVGGIDWPLHQTYFF